MPIDPEVQAEIAAIKKALLKAETDLSSLTGSEKTALRKEIDDMKATLADVLGKLSIKPTPAPVPATKPGEPVSDPVADFLDGKS